MGYRRVRLMAMYPSAPKANGIAMPQMNHKPIPNLASRKSSSGRADKRTPYAVASEARPNISRRMLWFISIALSNGSRLSGPPDGGADGPRKVMAKGYQEPLGMPGGGAVAAAC